MSETPGPTPSDVRAGELAAVLAAAVREGQLQSADAMRLLKHELRRRNTNKQGAIWPRSKAADDVIAKYSATGHASPKNDSLEALHADHVHPLCQADLDTVVTVEDWLRRLAELRPVVCVTAEENYRLMVIEKTGVSGYGKWLCCIG